MEVKALKRTQIFPEISQFPAQFHPFLEGAALYDSSCSPNAQVYYIEKGPGFYLKSAPTGTLRREAQMTAFFHEKGLSCQVLAYAQEDRDWLLTQRIAGEDCLWQPYLDDPKRLCDTLAQLLRSLHETDTSGCPVPNRGAEYVKTAQENYAAGRYDHSLFPDNWGYSTAEEAFGVVQEFSPVLECDVLLHGDYCLPNIMLNNWHFSGFLDLGAAGIGDRHIDLFWGIWSLQFNLKTDAWQERFLDAYGRDRIRPEILHAIGAFEVFQ